MDTETQKDEVTCPSLQAYFTECRPSHTEVMTLSRWRMNECTSTPHGMSTAISPGKWGNDTPWLALIWTVLAPLCTPWQSLFRHYFRPLRAVFCWDQEKRSKCCTGHLASAREEEQAGH